jgi:hypothetical protein
MKRVSWTLAAVTIIGLALAGCVRILDFETEKPMVVMTPSAPAPVGLAPVKDSPARTAHSELTSFAAG